MQAYGAVLNSKFAEGASAKARGLRIQDNSDEPALLNRITISSLCSVRDFGSRWPHAAAVARIDRFGRAWAVRLP